MVLNQNIKIIKEKHIPKDHNLQLLLVRVVVDILGQLGVDEVIFNGNVDSDSFLDVHDLLLFVAKVLLLHLSQLLQLLHLLQQLQARLVRLEAPLLQLHDVVCRSLHGALQVLFPLKSGLVFSL